MHDFTRKALCAAVGFKAALNEFIQMKADYSSVELLGRTSETFIKRKPIKKLRNSVLIWKIPFFVYKVAVIFGNAAQSQ